MLIKFQNYHESEDVFNGRKHEKAILEEIWNFLPEKQNKMAKNI